MQPGGGSPTNKRPIVESELPRRRSKSAQKFLAQLKRENVFPAAE